MTSEMIKQLEIREQLITGLKREISLQEKIIKEQQNTIDMLQEQLSKYQILVQEMLDS